MSSFFKLIGTLFITWIGMFALVMGIVTTGVAVIAATLTIGIMLVIGGIWLTLYLLRRDAQFDLHLPLVALVILGTAVVVFVAASMLRTV